MKFTPEEIYDAYKAWCKDEESAILAAIEEEIDIEMVDLGVDRDRSEVDQEMYRERRLLEILNPPAAVVLPKPAEHIKINFTLTKDGIA